MKEEMQKTGRGARRSRRVSGVWQKLKNRPIQYLLDFAVLAAAFLLAYAARFEFSLSGETLNRCVRQLPMVVLLQFGMLSVCGVYFFIWRYVGMSEVKVFLKAAVLATGPLVLMRLGLPDWLQDFRVPLSVLLSDAILGFGGVLGLRVARRFLHERYEKDERARTTPVDRKRALLVGAGRAGVLASKEILGRGDTDLEIVGFVDDDSEKQGSRIHGLKVLGTTLDLVRLVHQLRIEQVVITIAQAPRRQIKRILTICEQIPVKVRIMPGIWEILQGSVQISNIRDVEIEDLLGREPVQLDEEELRRFLVGRTVMVTGAGGSIGSELARQVARLGPRELLLVERAEFALFDIDREMRSAFPHVLTVPVVADVGDEIRMRMLFEEKRPQVIVHAAAHKHVPMMEMNPTEAIKNNILATNVLGTLAGNYGAEVFVLISTDKAVRPTSLMGASKRVAELVVQDLDRRFQTRFLAVRFGNVMGSAGSVIPIFREQIRSGGPVTITHPDMVRYFMTIPEASQLVLQAGAMGKGGEIFVLNMGDPVKIVDLATDMITLSGLKPHEDIEILYTGVRPGEKLVEELGTDEENVAKTGHPKIFIGRIGAYPEERVQRGVERLRALAQDGDEASIRRFFEEFLPEAELGAAGLRRDALASMPAARPTKTSVA